MRAHMAELGIVAAQGREGLKKLLTIIADEKDERLPVDARASLIVLAAANKMARVAWALLARGGTYRVPALAAT